MLSFLRRIKPVVRPAQMNPAPTMGKRTESEHPTIFHITHPKAGSQWIHKMFHAIDYHRLVLPEPLRTQFFNQSIQPGTIYPALFVTQEEFRSVALPANTRHFVVIRDLRDTLVSAYFSIRYSHPVIAEGLNTVRQVLSELSQEEGFNYLMDTWVPASAQIQWSWVAAGEELIRYEDLLARDGEILERVLIDRCGLPIARERLQEIVLANRFENLTQGRSRGEEDVFAHERKGIAGDWKNHFTDSTKREFKYRFGSVLIATGYAKDFNW